MSSRSQGRKVVLSTDGASRESGSLSDRFAKISSHSSRSPAEEGRASRRQISSDRQSADRYDTVTQRRTGRPSHQTVQFQDGGSRDRGVRRGSSRGGRGGPRGGGSRNSGSVRGGGGGRGSRGSRGTRGGRGGRGGRGKGGRGGRGGRGGEKKTPLTKDALDKELESYMFKDEESAKSLLDQELEDYMSSKDDTGDIEVGGEDVKGATTED